MSGGKKKLPREYSVLSSHLVSIQQRRKKKERRTKKKRGLWIAEFWSYLTRPIKMAALLNLFPLGTPYLSSRQASRLVNTIKNLKARQMDLTKDERSKQFLEAVVNTLNDQENVQIVTKENLVVLLCKLASQQSNKSLIIESLENLTSRQAIIDHNLCIYLEIAMNWINLWLAWPFCSLRFHSLFPFFLFSFVVLKCIDLLHCFYSFENLVCVLDSESGSHISVYILALLIYISDDCFKVCNKDKIMNHNHSTLLHRIGFQ